MAPLLKGIYISSFSKGYIPPSFKRAAIAPYLSLATNVFLVTTGQFH